MIWTIALLLAGPQAAQTANDREQALAAKSNPFCKDIFELLDARPNRFASIRGAYRTDDENWVSLVSLPGSRSCIVREWSSVSTEFSCSWSMANADEAVATARELANNTRWCVWYGLDYQTGPVTGTAGPMGRSGRTRFTHRLSMFRPGKDSISTSIEMQAWADASNTRAGVIFTIGLRDYS